jgi:hypothetical protein
VEISGFVGDWDVLNGTYVNDVCYSFDRKQPLADNNHTVRASMVNYCHGFDLLFDSHALPAQTTGATKGYGTYSGSPVVSVTHYIQEDMSYNSFVGALVAYIREAYGTTEHAKLVHLVETDGSGRLPVDWDVSAGVDVQYTSITDYSSKLANYGTCDSLYNSENALTTFWLPADPFNMLATFTGVAGAEYGLTVADNYLESVNQIWWTFTGTEQSTGSNDAVMVGVYQEHVATVLGLAQPSSSIAVTHAAKGSSPGAGWAPFGCAPGDPDLDIAKNFFNFGIIKQSLTNVSQKVGYICLRSLPFITETANSVWNYPQFFYPQGQTFQNMLTYPDPSSNGIYALPVGYIMRWFAAEGVTDVIADNATNYGGYTYWIAQHFGENRKKLDLSVLQPLTDNQLGNTTLTSSLTSVCPAGTADLECTFLNTTYGAGTVWNSGKVVVLHSDAEYSSGILFRSEFLGDNRDGVIGACEVKHLGNCRGYFYGYANYLTYPVNTAMNNVSTGALTLGYAGEGASTVCTVDSAGQRYSVGDLTSVTDMSPNSSTLKGPGNAWVSSFEQLVYPDFGFSENTRPLLPGDARSQQPDPADPATWRYAYLEEAIREIKLTW